MNRQPAPVCKAFLLCHKIEGNTLTLVGPQNAHVSRFFPDGRSLA